MKIIFVMNVSSANRGAQNCHEKSVMVDCPALRAYRAIALLIRQTINTVSYSVINKSDQWARHVESDIWAVELFIRDYSVDSASRPLMKIPKWNECKSDSNRTHCSNSLAPSYFAFGSLWICLVLQSSQFSYFCNKTIDWHLAIFFCLRMYASKCLKKMQCLIKRKFTRDQMPSFFTSIKTFPNMGLHFRQFEQQWSHD